MRGAPASVFQNTVLASKRLLDGMLGTRPKRVILVSSLSVYGSSKLSSKALIDETAELEQRPEKRDVYTHSKLRQELLFREYQAKNGFELVILRPGVIYGKSTPEFSARVGLVVGGLLLHFGGRNLLPLTYVDNCAEAVVVAGTSGDTPYSVYNMVDDALPTSAEYLSGYRDHVGRIHSVRFPFCITGVLSAFVERYSIYSRGQIPPVLTPYKSAALWKGNRYSNARIKSIGWQQHVPTDAALLETFEYFKSHKSGYDPAKTQPGRCLASLESPAGSA
jgi:nucleoside-diphosphate-sugar epimerase